MADWPVSSILTGVSRVRHCSDRSLLEAETNWGTPLSIVASSTAGASTGGEVRARGSGSTSRSPAGPITVR